MNSILKKGVGLFFTTEDVEEKQETKTTKQVTSVPVVNTQSNYQSDFTTQSSYASAATNDYHPMQAISNADTQRYKEHLIKVMKDNNLPGPDYFELNDSLERLSTVIADIRQRFVAAFTVLVGSGLTKEKVLSSGQSYLTALDNDSTEFSQSLQTLRTNEIDNQKTLIEDNNKKIQELSAQIQQLNTDNMNINQKVLESEQKIASNKSAYELELNNMKKTINDNLSYVNQFIQ